MGVKILKNNIEKALGLLENYKSELTENNVLEMVAGIGKKEAETQYALTSYTPDNISAEIRQNGVDIKASGDAIAYVEFGTGLVGEGTYEGNLPTETITFESPKGERHTTQGWVYYYDNPKTKVLGGWFYGKTFTRGERAKAQMFKTRQALTDAGNGLLAQIGKSIKENKNV